MSELITRVLLKSGELVEVYSYLHIITSKINELFIPKRGDILSSQFP